MSLYFKPAGTSGGGGGPSPWITATAYSVDQQVFYGGNFYNCIVAHTSGTNFVDDLALGKWAFINSSAHTNPNLMLAFNNFEANSALGWTATGCATVTNGLPVSVGSGGTAFSTSNGGRAKGANTTAAAVTSSGPIDGIYSLNLATSGAGTIGDGYISQSIPISIGYQAKVMVASCKFKVASGTPVMGGTSADTYAIAVYDITNNAWLGVNGAFSFTQSSGVGDARVTFQTASTTAAVQIFIYSPIAPTGSSSLLLDNFYLGQQSVAYGSPVTDWVSYTPTGTWSTNTTYTGKWRRVGDSAEIRILLALAGAPTSATLTVTYLPTGLAIDTAKTLSTAITGGVPIGTGLVKSAGNFYDAGVFYASSTTVGVSTLPASSGANNLLAAVTQAAPGTFTSGDSIELNIIVPITGWSSSVIMSSDAATNVVAASYKMGTAQTLTSAAVINWDTLVFDTHGAMSSGTYTVKVAGYYRISYQLFSITATAQVGTAIRKNASAQVRSNTAPCYSGGTSIANNQSVSSQMPFIIQCNAGDTLDIYISTTVATGTLYASPSDNWISIERISGPAQIAASESVSALYTGAPPTGTLTNAYNTTTYGTKVKDTHGAYASGTYTVPVSGTYSIAATARHTATYAVTNLAAIGIYIDGAQSYANLINAGGVQGSIAPTVVAFGIPLLAGQLVTIKNYNSASSPSFEAVAADNYFSIVRTGNY